MKNLSLLSLILITTLFQSCSNSTEGKKLEAKKPLGKNIEYKILDTLEDSNCLFEPFKSTKNFQGEQIIISSIQELSLGYDCIAHISTTKVRELETNFQNYDLVFSKKEILSININDNLVDRKACPKWRQTVAIKTKDTNERKVYVYGIKPKKTYTNIPCP